jgi:hypothetical protein
VSTDNTLSKSDSTDSAKSAMPHKTIAGNAEIEEPGVLFRDYHKTIFPVKADLPLSTRSQRLNLRFQNLIKICS